MRSQGSTSKRRAPQRNPTTRGPVAPTPAEVRAAAEVMMREWIAATEPAPEGYAYCPRCARLMRTRKDGTIRAHRARPGYGPGLHCTETTSTTAPVTCPDCGVPLKAGTARGLARHHYNDPTCPGHRRPDA